MPRRAELFAMGEGLRKECPRHSHSGWRPRDPIQLIEEADKRRIRRLMPLHHGRILLSPRCFFRGAALNMAADLATTRTSGVRVQGCGDAHLGNFRGFATPERTSCSRFMIWTRPFPLLGSGTSNDLLHASRWRAATTASVRAIGGCSAKLRPILSRGHGGIQRDAGTETVVRAYRCGKAVSDDREC
jgi:Uncharacterized protein conserved in bacteria (DUF2252)